MKHSDKTKARFIFDAAESYGIADVVISPGSRNAPLIIESVTREGLNKHVIVDERSAAFTALGMASMSDRPVMLICTSGSAVLNYHPAVAEAFYSQVPLIVVSADRPTYRIDKGEGQTIRQHGVLKNHTAYHTTLPDEENATEEIKEKIAKAFRTAWLHKVPVHINVPFEEPLYEMVPAHEPVTFEKVERELQMVPDDHLDRLEKVWKQAGKKLIIVSQMRPDERPVDELKKLAQFDDTVVLTENISNVEDPGFLAHIDRLIFPMDIGEWRRFAPDLVVTVGRNIISKKIKYLLRDVKPSLGHWHAGESLISLDTFDVQTEHIQVEPSVFLSQLLFRIYDWNPENKDYRKKWFDLAGNRKEKHDAFISSLPFGDMKFYQLLSGILPADYVVEWANSTVVRYAQLFDFEKGILHFSNRGTSGIDGSVSTAEGRAKKTSRPVLLVTGDLSFMYDSNGLWQDVPDNLKIIVINNGGGDIFKFIPGPSDVKGYDRFFVAKHQNRYVALAQQFGMGYSFLKTTDVETARGKISEFISSSTAQILEIDTSETDNASILKRYFNSLK